MQRKVDLTVERMEDITEKIATAGQENGYDIVHFVHILSITLGMLEELGVITAEELLKQYVELETATNKEE